MSYLRRISTRRLLPVRGGGGRRRRQRRGDRRRRRRIGPTPPPKPLAQAVHGALAAPPGDGVTARIAFTNHLSMRRACRAAIRC